MSRTLQAAGEHRIIGTEELTIPSHEAFLKFFGIFSGCELMPCVPHGLIVLLMARSARCKTGSELRTRLQPAAVAAVSIRAPPDAGDGADMTAAAFGLTQAETRLLASLLAGRTLADTAVALGIALATAKAHLNKVFAKTGSPARPTCCAWEPRSSLLSAPPRRCDYERPGTGLH